MSYIRKMPEGFGGLAYQDVTNVHSVGLTALLVLGVATLLLPRRWAIMPILIMACFIPSVQKIVVFGLDFNFLRIMVVFGFIRLLKNGEYAAFYWKPLDKVIIYWVLSSVLIYTLQQGNSAAFINRLGFAFDALGMYFLFRCLIKNWDDVNSIIAMGVLIAIPVAIAFIYENQTGHNLFSVFGGVPEFTNLRYDRLRCQGAFSHPILAGCFWASLMPLFAGYWWKSTKAKWLSFIGLAASSLIVVYSASSTPVLAVLSGVLAGTMFIFRSHMRLIRWGILFLLVGLHMVMNAPVWHLISRIGAVGGSTGYHRYVLINGAITHFNEWAFLGTKSTAHWGWGAQDLTNQYVLEAVRGGLLTLALFIIVITIAFREIGTMWRLNDQNRYKMVMTWALGVSLFVHCVNFIGVSYFGQIWVLWYLTLAMIGSLSVRSCAQSPSDAGGVGHIDLHRSHGKSKVAPYAGKKGIWA